MREHALFHISACTSPQRHCVSFHVSVPASIQEHVHTLSVCLCVCVCVCVYPCVQGDSLIPEVAGIGEGLQLHGWLRDSVSSLGLDDRPIDVLLQVDEAPVVAQRLPGRDVRVVHKVGVSHSVCAHDVIHVHANGVADFGRQGGC